jgi:16S rRNA G966 N2-methylase RsmD
MNITSILFIFLILSIYYKIYYSDNNNLIKSYQKPFVFKNYNYEYYNIITRLFIIFNSSSHSISLLDKFKISSNDAFLDIGSGNGYNLLYVNKKYNFKNLYGVEINKNTYDAAKYNLNLINSNKIKNYNQDVTKFNIPKDVNYIYLFNPFAKEFYSKKIDKDELEKYKKLINKIKISYNKKPRQINIIFVNIKPDSDQEKEVYQLFCNNFNLYDEGSVNINLLLKTKYAIFNIN